MTSKELQPVRGTHDLMAAEYAAHACVIGQAQTVAGLYGYRRIDTPIFEFSEVFHRAVGETSDIVSKETYTFTDRGGESLTLRPEFTAAVVRAFLSNKLTQELPFKCFYAGPAFRYERPQKGRMRQFHQFGAELLGANEPSADVEMIALGMHVLRALGLSDAVTLELNSLGDAESRADYRAALVQYLTQHAAKLSEDSRVRLEKNPLRILDSKDEGDRTVIAGAPSLHAHFNDASRAFYDAVKAGLRRLEVPFTENSQLVRGLDYYSHTVFEFTTTQLGAQGTVLGGGRYNGLVKLMGGPEIGGIGWAAGIERLVALREAMNIAAEGIVSPAVAVVPLSESAEPKAWELAHRLRSKSLPVEIAYKGNAKKRFARADKLGAKLALILGDDELANNTIAIKNLTSGEQVTVPLDDVLPKLEGMLKNVVR